MQYHFPVCDQLITRRILYKENQIDIIMFLLRLAWQRTKLCTERERERERQRETETETERQGQTESIYMPPLLFGWLYSMSVFLLSNAEVSFYYFCKRFFFK